MNDPITRVQRRIGAWLVARTAALRADDRGAFTTETAIITGILAALAVAIGGIIVGAANDWASSIPGVDGG